MDNLDDASPMSACTDTSMEDNSPTDDEYDQLEHFQMILDGGIQTNGGEFQSAVEMKANSILCSTLCGWVEGERRNSRNTKRNSCSEDRCITQIIRQLTLRHKTMRISHVAYDFDYGEFSKSGRNSQYPAVQVEVTNNVVATLGFHRRFQRSTDFAFCAGLKSLSPATTKILNRYFVTVTVCVFGKKSKRTYSHDYEFITAYPKEIDWPCINDQMFRYDGYISSQDDRVRVLVTYMYDLTTVR